MAAVRDGRLALRFALVLGLLIRVAVLWQTTDLGVKIADEQHYARIADNVLQRGEFSYYAGEPTSIRPPLYPGLVAAIWGATGRVAGAESLQAVRVAQILLMLAGTWLVYTLGRRAFGPEAGRYGAAVFWLYPTLIYFNFTILTETLFTCLLVAFVLCMVTLVQTPRAWIAIAGGLALGLAALTRSVLWPLPLVLCPLLVLLLRGPIKVRLGLPALVLAGYALAVAPWAIRNTRLWGVVEVVDTMGGMNLRMGNYEYTPDDRMWDVVSLKGEQNWVYGINNDFNHIPNEGEKDKWGQRKALAYIVANPGTTLRRAFIKFGDFWGLEREFIAGVQEGFYSPPIWLSAIAAIAMVAAFAAVAVLGGAGLWLAAPEWRVHVMLLLPVVAITGIHSLVFGHSRYHLPLMPILGLYAGALIVARRRATWRPSRPALIGAGLTVAVLVIVWVRQIVLVDAGRLAALMQHLR